MHRKLYVSEVSKTLKTCIKKSFKGIHENDDEKKETTHRFVRRSSLLCSTWLEPFFLFSFFFGNAPCIEDQSTRPVLACSCVRYISPDRVFAAFGHEGREHEGGERTKKRKRIEPRFRARALLYPLPPRRRVRFVLFSRVSRHEQGVRIPRHRFSPELVDPRYKIYVSVIRYRDLLYAES